MSRIIDLCMDMPMGEDYICSELEKYFFTPGMGNLKKLYGQMTLDGIKMTVEEADEILDREGADSLRKTFRERAHKFAPGPADFVKQVKEWGVEWGITCDPGHDNKKTSELVKAYPDTLKGFIFLNEQGGMPAVREFETCVREYGLHALYITPFRMKRPANDKRLYPVYAKAAELNVPVHFHCSMSSGADVPYDLSHPRYIDEVAMDFPELRIMASVGGFPWVYEFLTLPIRHKNLYINFETHRPTDLTARGSGMEAYLFYGESVLKDKLCFASNWTALGCSLGEVIEQAEALPFSDSMKEKMLYENAQRFYME